MENFKKLPVIALRSMTILPDTMIHFDLIRKKSILAAEQAMSEDQEVFLVTQCHAETEDPQAEDLYQIGCIACICLGIWWTAVYSGHHYIIDVMLGILTTIVGVLLMESKRIWERLKKNS